MLFLCVAGLVLGGVDSPDSSRAVRLVLTHQDYALTSDPVFNCENRIHAYMTFDHPLTGSHTLEGVWILPNGELGAHARVPLNYPEPGRRTAYLWLAFDGEPGAGGSGVLPRARGRPPVRHEPLDRQSIFRTPFQMICS